MAPTQYKAKKFTGELPALNGKTRIPSPYDQLVADAFKEEETVIIECPNEEAVRAAVIADLRKAAKFVGCGLDLWRSVEEGVVFKARAKREITHNAAA